MDSSPEREIERLENEIARQEQKVAGHLQRAEKMLHAGRLEEVLSERKLAKSTEEWIGVKKERLGLLKTPWSQRAESDRPLRQPVIGERLTVG